MACCLCNAFARLNDINHMNQIIAMGAYKAPIVFFGEEKILNHADSVQE